MVETLKALPLAGQTVAVTRALPAARETAAGLRELGAEVLLAPVLVVRPRPIPIDAIADVQAVIVTSRNGARRLAELDVTRDFPVFAVGARTAEVARRAGMKRVVSADGDGAALARLIMDALNPDEGALLHLRGRDVAGGVGDELQAAGFTWRDVIAYAAEFADELPADFLQALRDGGLDAVLFHSARGASAFAELIERQGVALGLKPVTAVAISEAARAPCDGLPFAASASAPHPSEAALIGQLIEILGAERASLT
jgi:uroporphyrinogen-III synthase